MGIVKYIKSLFVKEAAQEAPTKKQRVMRKPRHHLAPEEKLSVKADWKSGLYTMTEIMEKYDISRTNARKWRDEAAAEVAAEAARVVKSLKRKS